MAIYTHAVFFLVPDSPFAFTFTHLEPVECGASLTANIVKLLHKAALLSMSGVYSEQTLVI